MPRGKCYQAETYFLGCLSSHPDSAMKKNAIMPFSATWMDLEIIILSEVSQRQTLPNITYMQDLKNSKNEFIYKTETDSQT